MRRVALSTFGLALAATLVASGACSDGNGTDDSGIDSISATPTATPEKLVIELDDFYIDPEEMHGEAGQILDVTVFSEGQQTHTLTIDELGVDRELPASDTQLFLLTLTKAGTFKVYCRYHEAQGMTATFTVIE